MSQLPLSATFHERVQDCFVAYRGRGVSLSSADMDLLDVWAEAEVPFEVIARGLRKAVEAAQWDNAPGQSLVSSLKACRRHVQTEIDKYLRLTAGRTETPSEAPAETFVLTRHRKLVAALRKVTKPNSPEWISQLPVPQHFDEGERQERLAMSLLVRALPFPRRLELLREARQRMGEHSPLASMQLQREALHFHRAALVRHAWSLPALW